MSGIAIGNGGSVVDCPNCGARGTPCSSSSYHWDNPTKQSSDECSSTVFIHSIGVVLEGHKMSSHPWRVPCVSSPVYHEPVLDTIVGVNTVYAEGRRIAKIGDKYNSDSDEHVIETGSTTVFIG